MTFQGEKFCSIKVLGEKFKKCRELAEISCESRTQITRGNLRWKVPGWKFVLPDKILRFEGRAFVEVDSVA